MCGLFLFKLKLPIPIKVLLPFTYFFLYEYTVKTRSYCLIFPLLVLIASIYKERKEKVILYNILLGILATVSLHSAVISGILYIFEVSEIFKSMLKEDKIKQFVKPLICCTVLGILYCLILLCVVPNSDVFVATTVNSILISNKSIFSSILVWIIRLLEAFTLNRDGTIIHLIISLVYFIVMMFFVLRKNKNKFLFLCLFILEVVFIFFVRVTNHHLGLILYTFLFALYLVKDELHETSKKVIYVMLCVMFVIQIFWSIITIIPEIKYNYSSAEEVSNYLKEKDYKNIKIYSSGYYATAILPYFENNIFYNDRGETLYYKWSRQNQDWLNSMSKEFLYKNETDEIADIIILQDYSPEKGYETLLEKIREMENYKEIHFDGNTLYKGIRDTAEKYEYEGYYVFERVK